MSSIVAGQRRRMNSEAAPGVVSQSGFWKTPIALPIGLNL